jgi:hypothetical protein
MEIGDPEER